MLRLVTPFQESLAAMAGPEAQRETASELSSAEALAKIYTGACQMLRDLPGMIASESDRKIEDRLHDLRDSANAVNSSGKDDLRLTSLGIEYAYRMLTEHGPDRHGPESLAYLRSALFAVARQAGAPAGAMQHVEEALSTAGTGAEKRRDQSAALYELVNTMGELGRNNREARGAAAKILFDFLQTEIGAAAPELIERVEPHGSDLREMLRRGNLDFIAYAGSSRPFSEFRTERVERELDSCFKVNDCMTWLQHVAQAVRPSHYRGVVDIALGMREYLSR